MTALIRKRRRNTDSAENSGSGFSGGSAIEPFGYNEVSEEERADEDRRLAAVLRVSRQLTTILSDEGLIEFQSSPSGDLLGYEAENMVGVSFATLVNGEDIYRWEAAFEKVVSRTGPDVSGEWSLRRSDGTLARVHSTMTNLLHDPTVAGIVVVSRPLGEIGEIPSSMALPAAVPAPDPPAAAISERAPDTTATTTAADPPAPVTPVATPRESAETVASTSETPPQTVSPPPATSAAAPESTASMFDGRSEPVAIIIEPPPERPVMAIPLPPVSEPVAVVPDAPSETVTIVAERTDESPGAEASPATEHPPDEPLETMTAVASSSDQPREAVVAAVTGTPAETAAEVVETTTDVSPETVLAAAPESQPVATVEAEPDAKPEIVTVAEAMPLPPPEAPVTAPQESPAEMSVAASVPLARPEAVTVFAAIPVPPPVTAVVVTPEPPATVAASMPVVQADTVTVFVPPTVVEDTPLDAVAAATPNAPVAPADVVTPEAPAAPLDVVTPDVPAAHVDVVTPEVPASPADVMASAVPTESPVAVSPEAVVTEPADVRPEPEMVAAPVVPPETDEVPAPGSIVVMAPDQQVASDASTEPFADFLVPAPEDVPDTPIVRDEDAPSARPVEPSEAVANGQPIDELQLIIDGLQFGPLQAVLAPVVKQDEVSEPSEPESESVSAEQVPVAVEQCDPEEAVPAPVTVAEQLPLEPVVVPVAVDKDQPAEPTVSVAVDKDDAPGASVPEPGVVHDEVPPAPAPVNLSIDTELPAEPEPVPVAVSVAAPAEPELVRAENDAEAPPQPDLVRDENKDAEASHQPAFATAKIDEEVPAVRPEAAPVAVDVTKRAVPEPELEPEPKSVSVPEPVVDKAEVPVTLSGSPAISADHTAEVREPEPVPVGRNDDMPVATVEAPPKPALDDVPLPAWDKAPAAVADEMPLPVPDKAPVLAADEVPVPTWGPPTAVEAPAACWASPPVPDDTQGQGLRDPITGLVSWALFRDRLDQAVARAERTNDKLAVILVDLGAGEETVASALAPDDERSLSDEVLRAIGSRLASIVRVGDTVARFDRSRFGIFPDASNKPNFERLGARIFDALRGPLIVDGVEILVKASIGMATTENGFESAGELLAHTEIALQSAKSSGSDCFENYAAGFHGQVVSHPVPVAETGAFLRNEMTFHFQPIFELASRTMVRVEALLRWNHPRRGLVMPAEFLPIAEQSGQIRSLAGWAIPTVCREARHLQLVTEMPTLGVAVNLSRQEFDHPGLIDVVASALSDSRLAPGLLTLEIAESALLSDADAALPVLEGLRRLGVRVSIDDFGTGHSSLSDLGHLPVDELKIDPSLVREATTGDRPPALLSAVASLANSLGLQTVVEGIETEEQLGYARHAGCGLAQGYLLGRPTEAQRLNRMIARDARVSSFEQQIAVLNDILEKSKEPDDEIDPPAQDAEVPTMLNKTG
jgi:diguanylate cyclase (GGDEF)-like protein